MFKTVIKSYKYKLIGEMGKTADCLHVADVKIGPDFICITVDSSSC